MSEDKAQDQITQAEQQEKNEVEKNGNPAVHIPVQADREGLTEVELQDKEGATVKAKHTCATCLKELEKLTMCSKCYRVSYCSKKCATEDWPTHKHFCRPKDFGVVDAKSRKFLHIYSDEHETYFVAKENIDPMVQVLDDEPVFFLANSNFYKFDKQLLQDFAGDFKDRFHWSGSDEFNPRDPHEYSILKLAINKAAWICYEGGLRLKSKYRDVNIMSDQHPKNIITQYELDELKKEYHYMTQEQFYKINKMLVPSLTRLYSRGSFNVIGEGLFKNAWRLSLSCSPNSMTCMCEGRLKVVTLKPIKAGDKITVGFHPFIMAKPLEERTSTLFRSMGLKECYCARCRLESTKDITTNDVPKEVWTLVDEAVKKLKPEEVPPPADQPNRKSTYKLPSIETVSKAFSDLKSNHGEEICKYPLLVAYMDLVVGSYMTEYMYDLDDAKLGSDSEKQHLAVLINSMHGFIDKVRRPTDQEASVFMGIIADRCVHNFLYNFKMDHLRLVKNRKMAEVGASDLEDKDESSARIIHNLYVQMNAFLQMPYIQYELQMLGVLREDVDYCMSMYKLYTPRK